MSIDMLRETSSFSSDARQRRQLVIHLHQYLQDGSTALVLFALAFIDFHQLPHLLTVTSTDFHLLPLPAAPVGVTGGVPLTSTSTNTWYIVISSLEVG